MTDGALTYCWTCRSSKPGRIYLEYYSVIQWSIIPGMRRFWLNDTMENTCHTMCIIDRHQWSRIAATSVHCTCLDVWSCQNLPGHLQWNGVMAASIGREEVVSQFLQRAMIGSSYLLDSSSEAVSHYSTCCCHGQIPWQHSIVLSTWANRPGWGCQHWNNNMALVQYAPEYSNIPHMADWCPGWTEANGHHSFMTQHGSIPAKPDELE